MGTLESTPARTRTTPVEGPPFTEADWEHRGPSPLPGAGRITGEGLAGHSGEPPPVAVEMLAWGVQVPRVLRFGVDAARGVSRQALADEIGVREIFQSAVK